MIDRGLVLLLAGCAFFSGLIVLELTTEDTEAIGEPRPAATAVPASQPRLAPPRNEELLTTMLARPLFSPTRQPPAAETADKTPEPGLNDVRLTGIVIDPDRHLAVFAIPGAKPIVRSEGGTVNDWRIDSIELDSVTLSGPSGTITLRPKIDASLARRVAPPPRPAPITPPSAAAASPPPRLPVQGKPAAAMPAPPGAPGARPGPLPAVVPPGAAPRSAPPGASPMSPALPSPARGRE